MNENDIYKYYSFFKKWITQLLMYFKPSKRKSIFSSVYDPVLVLTIQKNITFFNQQPQIKLMYI